MTLENWSAMKDIDAWPNFYGVMTERRATNKPVRSNTLNGHSQNLLPHHARLHGLFGLARLPHRGSTGARLVSSSGVRLSSR